MATRADSDIDFSSCERVRWRALWLCWNGKHSNRPMPALHGLWNSSRSELASWYVVLVAKHRKFSANLLQALTSGRAPVDLSQTCPFKILQSCSMIYQSARSLLQVIFNDSILWCDHFLLIMGPINALVREYSLKPTLGSFFIVILLRF
jgi:hypothetical protein